MKIAIVDLETTGLSPYQNAEIIEIGMIVFDTDTGVRIADFSQKVKPEFPWLGTDEAMKVNGYNEADWVNAVPLKRALEMMEAKANNCVFASWNVAFDWGFIDWAFRESKMKNFFAQRKLDVLSMAYQWAYSNITVADFKAKLVPFRLKNFCLAVGVEPEPEVHRAINGAECAYQIFKEIQK